MKKIFFLTVLTLSLLSCAEDRLAVDVTSGTVTFELSAVHPAATKAVKAGWEAGDVIYVFFTRVAAPRYLKMTYDGSSWVTAEMDGGTPTPDCMGLKEGDAGYMCAVFLPFGRNAEVLADGYDFVFSPTYYSYYLTDRLYYSVIDNKVSGAFNMTIPEGYVQFFVEDSKAVDGAFTIDTDAVVPVGIARINQYSNIIETEDKVAGDSMPGYAYDGGYIFSGKVASWPSARNYYYFAKKNVSDGSRADYFVEVKQLSSHKAAKLPANNDEKWQLVGKGISVDMRMAGGKDMGLWYTCNYNQSVPENLGEIMEFDSANSIDSISLPTESRMEDLVKYCSWHWMTVHGKTGMVVKSDTGFLFLPTDNRLGSEGHYWTSTRSSAYAARLYFHQSSIINVTAFTSLPSSKYAVRPVVPEN